MRSRSLGDILAEENLIRHEQLAQAQRAADRSGTPLIAVLLDQGLIEEEALVQALCSHLDFELFDPRTEIDVDAVRELSAEDASRYRLLPVALDRQNTPGQIRVAMADPLDHQTIEELEFSTGCTVEPMIARPSDLVEAIRSQYRNIVTKIIPRGRDGGQKRSPRAVFGGSLGDAALGTRPVQRVQQQSSAAHRVDAMVALLVRKGLISQEEYEEQLATLVRSAED